MVGILEFYILISFTYHLKGLQLRYRYYLAWNQSLLKKLPLFGKIFIHPPSHSVIFDGPGQISFALPAEEVEGARSRTFQIIWPPDVAVTTLRCH